MSTKDSTQQVADVWEDEIYRKLQRDKQIAWRVAVCCLALSLLSIVTVIVMLPLKQSVPYILTVDKQTGYIEETVSLQNSVSTLTNDQAVIHHNIARYIIARETYDPQSVQDNFDYVKLHSGKNALTDYLKSWEQEDSPTQKYGHKERVFTTIKSISMLNEYTANVRLKTEQILQNGTKIPSHFAAIIQWQFAGTPATMADRLKNPLGFTVTSYRLDQETTQ